MASGERTEGAPATAAATGTETGAASRTASGAPAHTGPRAGTDTEGQRTSEPSGPVAAAVTRSLVDAVIVSCLTNAQYHAAREAFLDTLHRWFMFFVIALGAAALTDVLPKLVQATTGLHIEPAILKEVCAAGAAILAALDLTFDLSNRARSHAMMKRRYYELLASLREGKRKPKEVRVCIEQFSADEEPAYRVLYFACWNSAEMTVYGRGARRFDIGFWGNIFKNWFRRPAVSYPVIDPSKSG